METEGLMELKVKRGKRHVFTSMTDRLLLFNI
jgi:hypothetical protein